MIGQDSAADYTSSQILEAKVLVGGGAPPVDPHVVTKLPRALPLEPGETQEVAEKAPNVCCSVQASFPLLVVVRPSCVWSAKR